MAVWSHVNLSELEYYRVESDFYHSKYLGELEFWRRVNDQIAVSKLGRLIRQPVRTGRTPKNRLLREGEASFRFIKTDTVRAGKIDFLNSEVLPARAVCDRYVIPAGSLVITIIGATPEIVGRTAIVRSDDPACVTNQNVAVVSTKENFDPFFLTAYFQTHWGRDQIWRHSRRTEQVNLNCREVERILVPLAESSVQSVIGNLVTSSLSAADLSRELHHQAEDIINSELAFNKEAFEKPLGYQSSFSALETCRRFDSEHYYPAFKAFQESLHASIALEPLSKHLTFCQRGKQPIYASTGLPVINSKHVQPNRVLLDGNRSALPNPEANLQIRHGDTLLNGTGRGTLGRAAPCLSDSLAVPENHVTILRSGDLDPVYLSLYLNSAAGQMQVEMRQRGTSGQLELYPFDVRKFLIWPAPESFQRELRDLHEQAAAAERESKRLLEQAKTRVEQLIEEAAGG